MCIAVLIGRDSALTPISRIWTRITRALLVSKKRRHLFVTPGLPSMRNMWGIRSSTVGSVKYRSQSTYNQDHNVAKTPSKRLAMPQNGTLWRAVHNYHVKGSSRIFCEGKLANILWKEAYKYLVKGSSLISCEGKFINILWRDLTNILWREAHKDLVNRSSQISWRKNRDRRNANRQRMCE